MRITLLAAAAVLLALPAAASAKVGDLIGPTSHPAVIIAEGKYPKGRHWYVTAWPCGDNLPQHANYGLGLGRPPKQTGRDPGCHPVGPKYKHLIQWSGVPGGKDTVWKRNVQYGGADPSIDALKVIVKNRWRRTPLFSLTPEQTAAAGFAPGSKFYVSDAPAPRTWRDFPNVGVAAYSGGKLVDCLGRDCESGGGT